MADENETNWKSWRNGVLVIAIIFAMVMFGGGGSEDDPYASEIGEITWKDWSRLLGVFLAFVTAFSVGFHDGRARKRAEKSSQTLS